MHSVRRVKTTEEQRQLRLKKEAGEIKKYKSLNDTVLKRLTDDAALNRTTKLLAVNPEHYTVWNIRRELITILPPASKQTALIKDLEFTESLLPTHPKVYWLWNHRRWVLIELTQIDPQNRAWDRELALVNKLLERDPRNFHGWAHRKWVTSKTPETNSVDREFAYTTKKINENFSNFSAWHCRAQLLPFLQNKPSLESELNYVYGAVAMDPQDQSGWLYYQWLLESPLFQQDINKDILNTQYDLISELWEEEESIWAGRMLCDIIKLQGNTVPTKTLKKLAVLDPLRKNRYIS